MKHQNQGQRRAAAAACVAVALLLLTGGGIFPAASGCAPRWRAAEGKPAPATPPPSEFRFEDVTEAAGIRFRHDDCRNGVANMMEQIGPGVAVLDYDGDGWLDLYFVNGRDRYGRGLKRQNALYRNNRDGTFTDVTEQAGVPGTGYGMGTAVADYDNDGDADLYVCQYGKNALYRNNGDGTFTDVTDRARVDGMDFGEPFHVGATWLDYDRDGRLDLFVTCYVDFERGPRLCDDVVSEDQRRFLHGCPPTRYPAAHCLLYRNNGNGTFSQVTRQAGIYIENGKSLGVVAADFDDDNWPDIYVANDSTPSFLFRNKGNGTFEEIADTAGVAVGSRDGNPMAGMGVDWGDWRNDGRLGLFVTDYYEYPNHLWENMGDGTLIEVTFPSGVGAPSLNFLGFGGGFLDFDNDGWLDIFVANGHVVPEIGQPSEGARYKQHPQLFRNIDGTRFEEVTAKAGSAFSILRAGRGAVWADLWNRGVCDILIAANTDAPLLMKNVSPVAKRRHFLSLRLVGTKSSRDAIGARVWVTSGSARQMREVKSGVSYLSGGDLRLHFGLGEAARADKVEILWPSGRRDTFIDLAADIFYQITEGDATPTRQSATPSPKASAAKS